MESDSVADGHRLLFAVAVGKETVPDPVPMCPLLSVRGTGSRDPGPGTSRAQAPFRLKMPTRLRLHLERAVVHSSDATLDSHLANALSDLEAAGARINTLDAS